MFEFTKSERPYMWQVHAWGTIFHKDWNKKSDNMCQVIRRLFLGVIFILLAPFVGSFAICALLELPIQALHGFYEPVFSVFTHGIGGFCYIIVGALLGICIVGGCIIGLLHLLFGQETLDLGGRAKRTFIPEDGFIDTWYDGFKQKYCPSVVMREAPPTENPLDQLTDVQVKDNELVYEEPEVEEVEEDEGPISYSTVVITCRVDENDMGADFEPDLQTDVEDILEDNWMGLEFISAEITERGQTDEEAEPTEEIDELVEDNDD